MSYVAVGHSRPILEFNLAHRGSGLIEPITAIGGRLEKDFARGLMRNHVKQSPHAIGMEIFLEPETLARKIVKLAFENDSFAVMYADPTLDKAPVIVDEVPLLFTHGGVVRLGGHHKNTSESDRIKPVQNPPFYPCGVDDKGRVSDPDRVKTVVLLLGDQALPTAVAVEFAQQASVKDRRRHS